MNSPIQCTVTVTRHPTQGIPSIVHISSRGGANTDSVVWLGRRVWAAELGSPSFHSNCSLEEAARVAKCGCAPASVMTGVSQHETNAYQLGLLTQGPDLLNGHSRGGIGMCV